MNANVNPVYADMVKVDLCLIKARNNPEMWKGWRNWSLQDIVRILKEISQPRECHGVTAFVMGNFALHKLLEKEADPNVPFEVIEKTVHIALETPIYMKKYDVLNSFSVYNRRAVCDFFKEFVKRGTDDARYYELIYTMLANRIKGSFPLGFEIGKGDGFNDKVLAKLPLEMQKQLKSYTFNEDDKDIGRRLCYSLLTVESLAM
jgi:hypothetical protein